jgi:hypothetical protein
MALKIQNQNPVFLISYGVVNKRVLQGLDLMTVRHSQDNVNKTNFQPGLWDKWVEMLPSFCNPNYVCHCG